MSSSNNAFIDGAPVRSAPRNRPDKRFWNEDIAWFLVESAGELGERGMALNLDSGGGGNQADTDHLHAQRIRAGGAVRRWRRLNRIWSELSTEDQATLRIRYRAKRREESEIVGLSAAFGELGPLAWELGRRITHKLAHQIVRERLLAERRARGVDREFAREKWRNIQKLKAQEIRISEYMRLHMEDMPILIDAASHELRSRLSRYKPGSPDPVILHLRERAEEANRLAHVAWSSAERAVAYMEEFG